MKRCSPHVFSRSGLFPSRFSFVRSHAGLLLMLATSVAPVAVWAQSATTENAAVTAAFSRVIPAAAQFGTVVLGDNSQAAVDGKAVRMAPGLRVFNEKNELVQAHFLRGQKMKVKYTIEPATGFLQGVWVLAEHEIPQRDWFGFIKPKPAPAPASLLMTRPIDAAYSTGTTDAAK